MTADWPLDWRTSKKVRSIIFALPWVPRHLEDDVVSEVQTQMWQKKEALLANPGVLSLLSNEELWIF